MKNGHIKLFDNKLEIDQEKSPNIFDIAEVKLEKLELHLVGLAKSSFNTENPTDRQIESVATILEHDLGFEF